MCYFKSTLRPLGKPVKWTKIITFDDHFQFFNLTAYKIYEKKFHFANRRINAMRSCMLANAT